MYTPGLWLKTCEWKAVLSSHSIYMNYSITLDNCLVRNGTRLYLMRREKSDNFAKKWTYLRGGAVSASPPDISRMMVQVLTSTAGSPVILAYDDGHLYRYMIWA